MISIDVPENIGSVMAGAMFLKQISDADKFYWDERRKDNDWYRSQVDKQNERIQSMIDMRNGKFLED